MKTLCHMVNIWLVTVSFALQNILSYYSYRLIIFILCTIIKLLHLPRILCFHQRWFVCLYVFKITQNVTDGSHLKFLWNSRIVTIYNWFNIGIDPDLSLDLKRRLMPFSKSISTFPYFKAWWKFCLRNFPCLLMSWLYNLIYSVTGLYLFLQVITPLHVNIVKLRHYLMIGWGELWKIWMYQKCKTMQKYDLCIFH